MLAQKNSSEVLCWGIMDGLVDAAALTAFGLGSLVLLPIVLAMARFAA